MTKRNIRHFSYYCSRNKNDNCGVASHRVIPVVAVEMHSSRYLYLISRYAIFNIFIRRRPHVRVFRCTTFFFNADARFEFLPFFSASFDVRNATSDNFASRRNYIRVTDKYTKYEFFARNTFEMTHRKTTSKRLRSCLFFAYFSTKSIRFPHPLVR